MASSRLRRAFHTVVPPSLFDFWAAEIGSTASADRCLAKVLARRIEARDTVTLVLKPNRHFRGFESGQHLNITIEVNGRRLTRSYSPSSISTKDGHMEITIRNVEGGSVSTQLCRHTQVGDVLELGAAFGEMTQPAVLSAPWLFLAAGSGITPLMSLIRAQLARGALTQNITLLYWAKTRADLCFTHELNRMMQHEPRLQVRFVLTQETNALPNELRGRPAVELIAVAVPELSECRIYACGPSGFVESVKALTATQARSFYAEAFTPAAPIVSATGTVRVELRASGEVLELAAGQSLLAALEAQGKTPSYGCRMGICNTCACGKIAGSTQNLNTGAHEAEPEQALRLCVSAATSDLILDL